jgi:tryptophan synthase alpha chain
VNRIDAIFAMAHGGPALIVPYICAGDPNVESTCAMLHAFAGMGIQVVEVGVPFSDPVGDGRSIAEAARRALGSGMTLAKTLDACRSVPNAPAIVLFSYLNPIARYGIERFARDASRSNVGGIIIADLPLDESAEVARVLRRFDIALPLLIAPGTPLQRAIAIAEASDGFAYVVSRLGVTGASVEPDIEAVERRLKLLRPNTRRPLAVGFGVARPEHVRRLAGHAEAVVVGSALVDAVAHRSNEQDPRTAAQDFLRPLLAAASRLRPLQTK